MDLSNNYILNFRNIMIIVCFVFCATGGAQAQALDIHKSWTSVGSAGTVDETDVGKVFFELSKLQMGRTVGGNMPTVNKSKKKSPLIQQTQSAVIRYNVTPVDGLFIPVNSPCNPGANTVPQLTLRYLATTGARVIAKLIEVDLATGAEKSLMTFDSTRFGASNDYQVQSISRCGPDWRFDFKSKAYYVEAKLTTNGIIANLNAAGIQMVKIEIVLLP
jgi:hypothetical protein